VGDEKLGIDMNDIPTPVILFMVVAGFCIIMLVASEFWQIGGILSARSRHKKNHKADTR
jgi:hypothetical protein